MVLAAANQDLYNYCALPLAHYASRPDQTLGRLFHEPESQHRTCFQRDRDRIIHSGAFRRLKSKTQVFVYHQGDHYRTRLTHTLEVAQISRTLARALMVNEDLAETVALAHDLGHPPFAHAGEDTLKACMKDVGGFDHNDQSLRVLTFLERKYPEFKGLNLTWETSEGVVKHNGPLIKAGDSLDDLPVATKALQGKTDLRLDTFASVEAQVAALADDIAYNNHDVEDGLHAGLLQLSDCEDVTLLREIMDNIRTRYTNLDEDILIYQMIREMIGAMVVDVLEEGRRRIADLSPDSPEDVRLAARPMIAFSSEMFEKVEELRSFLWTNMYKHYKVVRTMSKFSHVVEELYHAFIGNKEILPHKWQKRLKEESDGTKVGDARIVADYIACMTDSYAIKEHERLFEPYWENR